MKKLLIFLISLFISTAAIAAEETKIYVLPDIVKSQNISSPKFEEIYKKNINWFKNTFTEKFKDAFPNTAAEISDENKYKTFAAYLTLSRVSQNNIGDKSVQAYIPMTGTLNFVSPVSSEILYSESWTHRTTLNISKENASSAEKLTPAYKETYSNVLNHIIAEAKDKFTPFAIEAKVIDKYKNLYILDKGLSDGIAKGDSIRDDHNNFLSIIYSDLNYSIAIPMLGSPEKNSVFRKHANSSISQLKKPKILFINNSSDKVYNLFSAAIGSNADFSLTAISPSYAQMQEYLTAENKNYSYENLNNRPIPEYFIKLHFISMLHGVYPTNKSYNDVDRYGALACADIFNRQGEVIYSVCKTSEFTDEDINSRKFEEDYQFETLTRNVFSELAKDLAQNVKFKTASIPISKVNDETITLKDTNNILNYGDFVSVMKKVKTDKITDEVTIPTWGYKVIDIQGTSVTCSKILPIADDLPLPKKKDFVIANAISMNKTKTAAYNFITGTSEMKGSDIHLDKFDDLAFNAIASNINLPVSVNSEDFKKQIDELNDGGYGFKYKLKAPENKEGKSIEAKYRIKLLEEKKKGRFLEHKYEITCGIKVNDGKHEPKKSGLKQTVTIQVPPQNNEKIIKYELLKSMLPLLEQTVKNFK